jgi:hypothetical protein
VIYETLRSLAERDVATRNSQSENESKHGGRFQMTNSQAVARGFIVVDAWAHNDRKAVAVEVIEQNTKIRIRPSFGQGEAVYTLSLNDDGECRLVARGLELQPWQLLRRALEPVFYPADPD